MITKICRILFSNSVRKCRTNHFRLSITSFSSSASPPTSRVVAAEYMNLRHNFSAEVASKLSSIRRSIDPEKCDSVISILKKNGFTQTDVERLVGGIPRILSANPHKTVEPKIKAFIDSGFSPAETVNLIIHDPLILGRRSDYIFTTLSKLNEIFNSQAKVYKFLKLGRFPWTSSEKYMIPNIKYLEDLGVSSEHLRRYLSTEPRAFSSRTKRLRELVNRVEELGFSRSSKMLLLCIKTLSSMSKGRLERKLKVLKGLGFGQDDISAMMKKTPLFLSVSEEKMKKVAKYLLGSGEAEISTIVGYPLLLMFSLEKRIKHRLKVLKELRSKDLVHGTVSVGKSGFDNLQVLSFSGQISEG